MFVSISFACRVGGRDDTLTNIGLYILPSSFLLPQVAGTTQLWDVDPHTREWVARHGTAEEAAAAATTLSSRWRGKRARAQFEGPGGGRDVIDARGRIQESEARGDRLEKEVRHLRTSLGESPLLERGPVPELANLMKEFMQVSRLLPPSSFFLLLHLHFKV
jgi:hypothetical protein